MQIIKSINPNTKPRMTRSDCWKVGDKARPCVKKYWAYKDKIKKANIFLPESYEIHFGIQMPKSWSKKKKLELNNTKHLQTPDKDNLEKGFLDALFDEDKHIWTGSVSKWWSYEPYIIIKEIPLPTNPIIQYNIEL